MSDAEIRGDFPDSHYINPHWVRIGSIKELVVVRIDHGSKINLMSRDLYRKENWHISTKPWIENPGK